MEFGVSYYPELVSKSEWQRDLENMARTGFSTIRMLDFAWTKLEAREGCFTFEWLDYFLELVMAQSMKVVLCTPTATPPAWLATQFPQIMVEKRDGTREPFGSRRHVCVNSPVFQHFCVDLVQKLGKRYGRHPSVIGWQIDNELCGVEHTFPECHCPECNWLFRDWLKKHYASTDELNIAWGTGFWNQEYSDWGEIETPRNSRTVSGHVIDYQQFFSDSQVNFIKAQRDALRESISADQWISHNSTGVLDRGISHYDYAQELDVSGWDSYLSKYHFNALVHNMFRSAKDKPFIVFETNSDESGSLSFWGEMVARGASSIYFWHYRQHRFNAERNCQALCDHAGVPFPGRLEKVRQAVAKLGAVHQPETTQRAQAAILHGINNTPYHFDRDSTWGSALDSPYLGAIVDAYQPFWQDGVDMDFRNTHENLDDYKLFLLPSMELMDVDFAIRLKKWVEKGGILVATAKTAHLDKHGVFYQQRAELLKEFLGFFHYWSRYARGKSSKNE